MGGGTQLSSALVSLLECALQCDWEEMLTIAFVPVGADFTYCENFNNLLEVEWMGGDSEMTEEEYAEGRYCRDQLHPKTGGQYFWARLEGTGYHRGERFDLCSRLWWREMIGVCVVVLCTCEWLSVV
jgi:hypothetical protein